MRSFLFSSGRVGRETAIFSHPGIPVDKDLNPVLLHHFYFFSRCRIPRTKEKFVLGDSGKVVTFYFVCVYV